MIIVNEIITIGVLGIFGIAMSVITGIWLSQMAERYRPTDICS